MIRGLGQAVIVLGLGLILTIIARRRPILAGSAAVILMTTDLAAANARYVLTVPQSVFETKPELAKAIEDAERIDPAFGPFRIHRIHDWHPLIWGATESRDRDSAPVPRSAPRSSSRQPGDLLDIAVAVWPLDT